MIENVLTLDISGQPHRWMNYKDVICLKVKGLIAWELGDNTDTKRGGISRMTGIRSEVDVAPIVAIRGKFKYDARIPPLTNKNLFLRDLHTCGYCGRIYREDKLSRDHIVPVSKGGPNAWQNCITSCKTCNREKDDMLLSEAGMVLLYVPYVPSAYEKLILQNRKIIACQMEFLQNFLPIHSRLRQ